MPQGKDDPKEKGSSPESARGEKKSGAGDKSDNAKEKGSAGDKNETAQAKDAGPVADEKQATAKGAEKSPAKSETKDAGPQSPREAKAKQEKGPGNSGQPKSADRPRSRSRSEQGRLRPVRKGHERSGQGANSRDIERLKDRTRKEGPEGDDAARKLDQIAKEAKDPKVRELPRRSSRNPGDLSRRDTNRIRPSHQKRSGQGRQGAVRQDRSRWTEGR